MVMPIKLIYLESFSIIQIIILWKKVRNAETIVFHEKLYPRIQRQLLDSQFKKYTHMLVKLLNPKIQIFDLKKYDNFNEYLNKKIYYNR